MSIKIVSWNVNGIRAIMKKEFPESIEILAPDVLCLQETKAPAEEAQTALTLINEYEQYVNACKTRKGYSGTAILTKRPALSCSHDIDIDEHDQEGRVNTVELEHFYVVNVYVPNSGQGLKRLDYRQTWDTAFLAYVKSLEEQKPVVVCGDFNVAHQEIDIARAKQNYNKSAGYTQVEIDGFQRFLDAGFVDTFRHLHPSEVKYSYWNYMFNARARNVGWRIDYVLISESLLPNLQSAAIHNDFKGSDHCPVEVNLKF